MMFDRKLTLLLSAATVFVLLIAMTVMACSGDSSAASSEAQNAANEAARSAALASGNAADAVDDLVAANDALLVRVDELEDRLARNAGSAIERELASRPTTYREVAPARNDNYRTADYVEPRATEDRATYEAPSSRWDPDYNERNSSYDDRSVAADLPLRDDDWRARTVLDPPRPTNRVPDRDVERRSEPTWRRLTVESGTPIAVEIREAVSTKFSRPGDAFTARLANDLLADNGRVAIREGAEITGHVAEVKKNQRIGGRPALTVTMDTIELPDGSSAPIKAAWATKGKSQTPRDAATIGGATVGGAILGRILDKGDGDVIGGLVGAAAGTAVAHQVIGKPIAIGSGAVINMHLRAPIEVRVRN